MKKMNLKQRFKDYVPLGIDPESEIKWVITGIILSALFSLGGFLISYMSDFDALFYWKGGERIVIEGVVMRDFAELIGVYPAGFFSGFVLIQICMIGVSIYHYVYHYLGSTSMYVMKRFPSKSELWKRCLAMPILLILVCAAVSFILMLLYFVFYMLVTPDQCLQPLQWHKIWNRSLIQPVYYW